MDRRLTPERLMVNVSSSAWALPSCREPPSSSSKKPT